MWRLLITIALFAYFIAPANCSLLLNNYYENFSVPHKVEIPQKDLYEIELTKDTEQVENNDELEEIYKLLQNEKYFSALDYIDKLEQTETTDFLKAKIYYNLSMFSDSKKALDKVKKKDTEELRIKLLQDKAFTITPNYEFFNQVLNSEYDLDYQKYGVTLSEGFGKNSQFFLDYNIYSYNSSPEYHFRNVTNELRVGVNSKPKRDLEYHVDFGAKFFQHGNRDMLITNTWVEKYFNDDFSIKLGYNRNNLEQSYLTAVGTEVNNVFTGRTANNKFYGVVRYKLPKKFYTFFKGSYGIMHSQNLATNQYFEAMLGAGREIYSNPKGKIFKKINFDIITYNSGYQFDELDIYDNTGRLYGGYFSPRYFNATTGNLKMEGSIKKFGLRYGLKLFAGEQVAINPDFIRLTWGFAPYINLKITDHLDVNASYNYYKYADTQRHLLMVSAVIKLFRK